MNNCWPTAKLGEVLKRVERFESRDELTEYPFAGTYSFAHGIFVGVRKFGSTFALPKVQRIREGDFVYCKIMAWEGAFGLVPKEADNCVLSGAFVVYELNDKRIDPKFLDYFFKVPAHWQSIGSQSSGTNVRRQSLHPTQFEKAEVPLPPLAEQRLIVTRIEELAAKVHEARDLRKQAVDQAEALCRSILSDDKEPRPTPMHELVRLRPPDVLVRPEETYQFAGVYCFGRGVFRGEKKTGLDFAYTRLTRLHGGNFVYPKLMAWEGALGVVPPECDGCVVSTEFPVFEVIEEKVLPEVLDTYFRTPAVWPEIAGASTGTNVRRRRLNPKDFLNYHIPLPSRVTQDRLRKVQAQVNTLKSLQAETLVELDALIPSILDKAFRGEL